MSETYETVTIERHDAVARVVMNRPDALNTFNAALRRDLCAAVREMSADPDVRVVILAGAGRAFCAGADLSESLGSGNASGLSTELQINEEYKPIITGIAESPKLWISEVQGAAAGIGSALAMVCDLTLMTEKGYLYQAFAAIGLIPDGGATWLLLRAVGRKRAMEIILGGERVYGPRCLELGLCNRVVAEEELTATTFEWAQMLAAKAPLALQYSKRAVAVADSATLEELISAEATIQHILIDTDDFKEGVTAFFEKRPAQFKGS